MMLKEEISGWGKLKVEFLKAQSGDQYHLIFSLINSAQKEPAREMC